MTIAWILTAFVAAILMFVKWPWARSVLIILVPPVLAYADWARYQTDWEHILGYPFSDAFSYLSNGLGLTNGFLIDQWGGRRPLYSSFLAALFKILGARAPMVLIVQATLLSVTIAHFERVYSDRLGRQGVTVAVFVVLIFGIRYYSNTLTENLGLPLGLLALCWLGRQEAPNRWPPIWGALFCLTLGLLVRAGAFFCIPALLGYFWVEETLVGRTLFYRWLSLARHLSAVLLALVTLKIISSILVVEEALAFSNFSFTLYGLVKGGMPWNFVYTDRPDIFSLISDEALRSKEIYRQAIESLLNSPSLAFTGALKAWLSFFMPSEVNAFGFLGVNCPKLLAWAPGPLFTILAILGVYRTFHLRHLDSFARLNMWLIFGIFLSIPFLQPIDAECMRVYAVTLPLFAILSGYGVLQVALWMKSKQYPNKPSLQFNSVWTSTVLTIIYFILITLPLTWFRKVDSLFIEGFSHDRKARKAAFVYAELGRTVSWDPKLAWSLKQFSYPNADVLGRCIQNTRQGTFGVARNQLGNYQFVYIVDPTNWIALTLGRSVELFKMMPTGGSLNVYTDTKLCILESSLRESA